MYLHLVNVFFCKSLPDYLTGKHCTPLISDMGSPFSVSVISSFVSDRGTFKKKSDYLAGKHCKP